MLTVVGSLISMLFSVPLSHTSTDISKRNPYFPVERRAPLINAIELMSKWKVHRVPVIDADGDLVTLITQSHIVKFVYKYMSKLEHLADRTVERLQLGYPIDVVTVQENESTIKAFEQMQQNGVSAVGVVNDEGKLVGNVSVSDLKAIGYDGKLMSHLFAPVSEFLKLAKPDSLGAITVTPQATFASVVEKLVNNRIHRIFVIDPETEKPLGVISLLEILKCIHI